MTGAFIALFVFAVIASHAATRGQLQHPRAFSLTMPILAVSFGYGAQAALTAFAGVFK